MVGFPGGSVVKNPHAKGGDARDTGSIPWVEKIHWRRKWQHTPVFLPGKFHEQRSLVGYSTGGLKESDMMEHLSTCSYIWEFLVYPFANLCIYVSQIL